MIVYIAGAFFATVFGVIMYFIFTRDEAEKEIIEREHHHHEHRGYCTIEPKVTEKYDKIFPEDKPEKDAQVSK
jgi:hypothetical protein